GNYRANWREPSGRQRAKTFPTKREAKRFIAEIEASLSRGMYVDPHAGRLLFATHARQWLDSRNDELTTKARDASIMHTHVLPQWGSWPLSKIDHLSVQTWVTELGTRRAPATVAEAHRLTSAVLRSAVRNRLIAFNPCEGIRLPRRRRQDTADQVISRDELRSKLLPAAPDRYRAIIATAAGAGLRWGEAAGLRRDALDLDHARLSVIRTVIEVGGHTSFKPYPKSGAGRRTVPLPGWLVPIIREHLDRYPVPTDAPVYANTVGKPLRRTLFRARVWRPALVQAGMLGTLTVVDEYTVRAGWTDATGATLAKEFPTERDAVLHIARSCAGGFRFHDLRHSYATWLVDDGVPVNMVQRVMGHERSSTTLDLYTRRTDDHGRILRALDDEGGPDGNFC
ncbi:MAG: tyrosine-type recombinase/integrase, partial [Pseudonocardiaceae bacterium]